MSKINKPYFRGDKVLVNTTESKLLAAGITDLYRLAWLLAGNPKIVGRVEGNKLYLLDEKNSAAYIWVYDNMVLRWKSAADLG
jgi:hypothetical protein